MVDQLAKLEHILERAKLPFERSAHDESTELVSAVLNAETDLRMDIIALNDPDGYTLKLVAWIDDIAADRAADQLRETLTMNFIMALGRFAYQPDIDAIVYVADYPLNLLDDDTFQSILEEYFYFGNLYFESFYGTGERGDDDVAELTENGLPESDEADDSPRSRLNLKRGPDMEGHD